MIIRKSFRFEGAHLVRNCSSERCKNNIHGHSYIVEVFITSDKLDHGGMLVDFGLLGQIKEMIDRFDHAYLLWNKENDEYKKFIYQFNQRVIELPVSPSAEGLALVFFLLIKDAISKLTLKNGEGNVQLSSVRIHETTTGYAQAFREDEKLINFSIQDIRFSNGIK